MTEKQLSALKKRFGNKLKEIREDKNLSLRDLSANCDLDDSHISKIEQGKVNVALGTIFELAKGLDISPLKLLDI